MPIVSFEELIKAYDSYREIIKLPRNMNSRRRFFDFINETEPNPWMGTFTYKNMTDDAAHKVAWLNGPHAATMYKAWEIKNEG